MSLAAETGALLLANIVIDNEKPLQQQLLTNIANAKVAICPWATLDRRLRRWASLAAPPRFPRILRSRLSANLTAISGAPVATRWAYMRTIMNGWCTPRRFQRDSPCPFCGGCQDSLEHFARCPAVREVANLRLFLGQQAAHPLTFFLLDGHARPNAQCIRSAAFLHALYRTHKAVRHGPKPSCPQDRIWAS